MNAMYCRRLLLGARREASRLYFELERLLEHGRRSHGLGPARYEAVTEAREHDDRQLWIRRPQVFEELEGYGPGSSKIAASLPNCGLVVRVVRERYGQMRFVGAWSSGILNAATADVCVTIPTWKLACTLRNVQATQNLPTCSCRVANRVYT